MEFQSELENAPHDRTGHQSPCPTLTSFHLFSYIDFRRKAMQVPSYLYTAQWSQRLKSELFHIWDFSRPTPSKLLIAVSSSQVMAPLLLLFYLLCSALSSRSLICLHPQALRTEQLWRSSGIPPTHCHLQQPSVSASSFSWQLSTAR